MAFAIIILSSAAALTGILASGGTGQYEYESIRGQMVNIYGKGLYKHMSSDVAIQGIAQDYVTFFIAVPLLIISFIRASRTGSLRAKFVLSGTLGYFMVTYLFYMCMAMYNQFFLVYVLLTSLAFYSFILSLRAIGLKGIESYFKDMPVRFPGGFLIFNSFAIGLMWLGVVVPPLLSGEVYPSAVEHYTTLIVQGMDLSLLLPASFLSGYFLLKRKPEGFLFAPVYLVFLSLLMTALTAKIIAMQISGVSAGPALVIIPVFNLTTIVCAGQLTSRLVN